MGRPTKYNEELALKICERLAHSDKGLVFICNEFDLNPSTIYEWINNNPEFSNKYARAREMQADYLADQIIDISDETTNDTIKTEAGLELTNHEAIARSRLRVDARKWKASKLYPKKYADRIDSDLTSKGETINLPPFMRANGNKS
jgi:hypothetical protein